jgi:hypothetical protein
MFNLRNALDFRTIVIFLAATGWQGLAGAAADREYAGAANVAFRPAAQPE